MKKDSIQNMHSAFNQFLKEENLEQKFNEKKLIAGWYEVMEKPITSRTSKIFIKDEVMFVYLTSAPLKQELNNSKSQVLELLEKHFQKKIIRDIRFL